MFLAILRLKEFGGPVAVALQGLVLGGGLAMAMLADLRVLDANASVCFGNLSRGMVPCMLLSLHFALGLAEALDFYLTDDIASAATWQQCTGDTLVEGVLEAKTEAFGALRRMRQSYVATQLTQLTFDNFQLRFAREAQALQLSLRCESSPLVTTTRDGLVDVPDFKTLNHDDVKVELNLQPTKAQQESVLQHISIPVPSAHKLDVSTLQPAWCSFCRPRQDWYGKFLWNPQVLQRLKLGKIGNGEQQNVCCRWLCSFVKVLHLQINHETWSP